jgi:hypothetical protein
MTQNINEAQKEKVNFDSLPSLVFKLIQDVQLMHKNLKELKDNFQIKEPEEYLTRQDVATMFQIDLSTVHNWTKKGVLKPYYKGNKVYYLKTEVKLNRK